MKTQVDRRKIVSEIIKASKAYKQNLLGKTFLYVFDSKYIEVIFKAKDFRHLTGVDTTLSAQEFFKQAHQGKLQASQIFFSARHPYKLAQKKIKHLNNITSLTMGESFMLKEVKTQTELYKYGTTDLKFSLCFNKECDNNGIEQGDCFIAKSLRDEDCFSKSNDVFTIIHIFSKPNDKKKYDTLLYMDKNCSILSIDNDIKKLLSDTLFTSDKIDKSLLESTPTKQVEQSEKETNSTKQISDTTIDNKPQQDEILKKSICDKIMNDNPLLKHKLNIAAKEYLKKNNLSELAKNASVVEKNQMRERVLNANPDLLNEYINAQKALEQSANNFTNDKPKMNENNVVEPTQTLPKKHKHKR